MSAKSQRLKNRLRIEGEKNKSSERLVQRTQEEKRVVESKLIFDEKTRLLLIRVERDNCGHRYPLIWRASIDFDPSAMMLSQTYRARGLGMAQNINFDASQVADYVVYQLRRQVVDALIKSQDPKTVQHAR